jgi:hypothetical protein
MIRAIPVLILLVVLAVLFAAIPGTPMRWMARTWYGISPRGSQARVPEWMAYYLWSAPGDPVPGKISTLEDSLRTVAVLVLAVPLVLVLLLLVV